MAISKIIYKTSAQDTGTVWMDATPATAAAADILSPKTAMLADGILTTGTGSGGGSNWTPLASEEFTVNTTSTSSTSIGSISLGSFQFSADTILWIHIRDKAGNRNGYFYGSDTIMINDNGARPNYANPIHHSYRYNNNTYSFSTNTYGVYTYMINAQNQVRIYSRYDSEYSLTINGTFKCDVYALTAPSGMTLFD